MILIDIDLLKDQWQATKKEKKNDKRMPGWKKSFDHRRRLSISDDDR